MRLFYALGAVAGAVAGFVVKAALEIRYATTDGYRAGFRRLCEGPRPASGRLGLGRIYICTDPSHKNLGGASR